MVRPLKNPYVLGTIVSGSAFLGVLALAGSSVAGPAAPSSVDLDKKFISTIKPFLQTYCVSCHGKDKPQAQLDLTAYPNLEAVIKDFSHWNLVLEKVGDKQMPPTGLKQPSAAQREALLSWVRGVRALEIQRNAGDPGPVLARRLSNAEYDYTIRDLTGQELHPTKEFPVDPANQEGFDNTGESLTLSPALMRKYYGAAREIADHAVFTTTGLEFASHPALVETDRDKYCIFRIVNYYKRQPTDYADYFLAAWRYKHRVALGIPQATLASIANSSKVSAKYLDIVWKTLNTPNVKVGPIAKLQEEWNALPAPDKGNKDDSTVRTDCVNLRNWVLALRKRLAWKFTNIPTPGGFSNGGQAFIRWKNESYASHRRSLYPNGLQIGGVPATKTVTPRRTNTNRNPTPQQVTEQVDADLFVPQNESERAPYIASFEQFCSVFPDAFYISERGRMNYDGFNADGYLGEPGDRGRYLTAGLHNSMGITRDDKPLMELILDEKGQSELNHLWLDFDTVAAIPERMYREFFVYERAEASTITDPEFNFARPEDKVALTDPMIKKLGDLYLAKALRNGCKPIAQQAIEDYFKWVSTTIRFTERTRLASEAVHVKAVVDFAGRAFRRPLTAAERDGIVGFYNRLRKTDGLSHEDALRDTLVSILMSPKFLYRVDLDNTAESTSPSGSPRISKDERGAGEGSRGVRTVSYAPPASRADAKSGGSIQPLSDYALASRLSYFLWSSLPDAELLSHAAAGDLHKPEVLLAQTHRMLKDARVKALAVEFGGNWLDFRRFEEHNAVDRERFPAFTDDLREAMFQEPVHFLTDEFQNNRSILDLLYGKHTFVNGVLARHYGMNDVKVGKDEWVRVESADKYGRGGLLPMSLFLTQNAPGLRTSPVKRGYWVVRKVLGEHIPAPPPLVPELPKDESQLGNRTLRQVLEQHRSNPACAGCHARFDSYGLVFENYGPIGEVRTKDLGGKPVDNTAPFPGGKECTGVSGLQTFIREKRQQDFLDTFTRKLLSYGIGRSLQLSDDPTLEEMQKRLVASGYKADTLIDTIVTSRQFRYRRVQPNNGSNKTVAVAR